MRKHALERRELCLASFPVGAGLIEWAGLLRVFNNCSKAVKGEDRQGSRSSGFEWRIERVTLQSLDLRGRNIHDNFAYIEKNHNS